MVRLSICRRTVVGELAYRDLCLRLHCSGGRRFYTTENGFHIQLIFLPVGQISLHGVWPPS